MEENKENVLYCSHCGAIITTTSKIYVHAIQSADEVASDVIDGKLNPFHHGNNKEEAK